MLCVTLAALAAMVAEAFRGEGRAHADRRPRHHRPGRRRRSSSVLLWNRDDQRLRRHRAPTTSGCSSRSRWSLVGILTHPVLGAGASSATALPAGEYYALLLFSIVGMMMMATATDLLVIFLALEILSLAVYVLTGIRRDNAGGHRSGVQVLPARRVLERVLPLRHRLHLRRDRQHAAAARSARICRRSAMSAEPDDPASRSALLLVGFAFKISAVPFHMWTPDAYEGAPPWSPASCPRA